MSLMMAGNQAVPCCQSRARRSGRTLTERIRVDVAVMLVVLTGWVLLAAYYTALPVTIPTSRRGLLTGSDAAISDTERTLGDDVGRTIGALLLSLVVGVAATAAGVGGGAFYVPLFNIVLQFSVKGSMALSQAAIAGGALAGCSVYLFRRHPINPTKHIIDFDLALMLTPPMLLGVAIGVLANILLPSWLITFLLIILLMYLSYITVQKAFKLHRAEQAAACVTREGMERDPESCDQQRESCTPRDGATSAPDPTRTARTRSGGCLGLPRQDRQGCHDDNDDVSCATETGAARQGCGDADDDDASCTAERGLPQEPETCTSFELQLPHACAASEGRQTSGEVREHEEGGEEHERVGPRFPWLQLIEMLLLWGAFLALQLEKSRFPRCSAHYIAMFTSQAGLLIACGTAFLGQAHMRYKEAAMNQLRQPILPSIYKEVDWTLPRLIQTSLTTLAGGITAGLLGIGGGMILSPLLLFLGVHPLVGSATSSVLVLFSSSSAALSFLFDDTLNWQFALLFALTSFCVALIGVLVVVRLVKRSGKASIVVMLLAFIIFSGAILTAAFAGRKAIAQLIHHQNLGFSPFCSRRTT